MPRPIVLGARDRLDRGHLAKSGHLAEHTGRDNKVTEDPGCRATISESEIHIPTKMSARTKSWFTVDKHRLAPGGGGKGRDMADN